MNIGDRVIVNGECDGKSFTDQPGKIVDRDTALIGIEFYEYIGGHDCKNKGKKGYCWNVYKEMVTIEKDTIEDFKKELDKITL